MNQLVDHLTEELRSAWRFRWIAFAVAGAVAVLGWLLVFSLPDRYESSARVFVDTRTAIKPVIKDLSIEQDVNAQLNFVRQSLLAGAQRRRESQGRQRGQHLQHFLPGPGSRAQPARGRDPVEHAGRTDPVRQARG